MRRQSSVIAVAVAVVLILAGCVGIPSSGGVKAGPLIDDPDSPEVEFVVSGPQKDASQEEKCK